MVKRTHRKAPKKRKAHYMTKFLMVVMAMGSFVLASGEQQSELSTVASSPMQPCASQFAQQQPPVLLKKSLQKNTYALCYQQFALQYSGLSKTPLWVAEYLTPTRLSSKVKRDDVFHEETRLPAQHRALLSDYRGSGFDRGHMAPSADMGSQVAQAESFSLANMVPQQPQNNQNVWRELEEATRALVSKQQLNIYVITGPLFEGEKIRQIGRGVLVPSALYKVLYVPSSGVLSAYVSPNDDSQRLQLISVCALEQRLGINLLPQLTAVQKRAVYNLPRTAKQVKAKQRIALLHRDDNSDCPGASAIAQRQQRQAFAISPVKTNTDDANTTSVNAENDNQYEHEPQDASTLVSAGSHQDSSSHAPPHPPAHLQQIKQAVLQGLFDWLWQFLQQYFKAAS